MTSINTYKKSIIHIQSSNGIHWYILKVIHTQWHPLIHTKSHISNGIHWFVQKIIYIQWHSLIQSKNYTSIDSYKNSYISNQSMSSIDSYKKSYTSNHTFRIPSSLCFYSRSFIQIHKNHDTWNGFTKYNL